MAKPCSQRELLEELRYACGCTYISDLHDPALRSRVLSALEDIPAQRFSAGQWRDALQYLLDAGPWGKPLTNLPQNDILSL